MLSRLFEQEIVRTDHTGRTGDESVIFLRKSPAALVFQPDIVVEIQHVAAVAQEVRFDPESEFRQQFIFDEQPLRQMCAHRCEPPQQRLRGEQTGFSVARVEPLQIGIRKKRVEMRRESGRLECVFVVEIAQTTRCAAPSVPGENTEFLRHRLRLSSFV